MAERHIATKSAVEDQGPGKGGNVKTKTVSSSIGTRGEGFSAKRPGQDDSEQEPTPPKVAKAGFSFSQPLKKPSPISIKLGGTTKVKETVPSLPAKKIAAVFNDDDDDSEPEEMPPEAKMRMKNIGRETPTSAGPNSFNKGKQGFSDHQKLWERKLKAQTDQGPSSP
ncbi:PEST proteolytic signal-containing nuclear protein-like isoform X2 [Engraulis encrasicolus]|uniref:PEST proteolytic signal-containing nuclear protein-like isoform X2 n=1 Tax=Engraulis encrasicolus TaxID=184585 RepID=UPI002FD1BF9D